MSITCRFIINSKNHLTILLFLKSISIISRGGPQPERSPWRHPRVQRRRSRWRGREFPQSRRPERQKCNHKPKYWIMTQEQIIISYEPNQMISTLPPLIIYTQKSLILKNWNFISTFPTKLRRISINYYEKWRQRIKLMGK